MNIIQLSERVLFHINRVSSPRVGRRRMNISIQIALDDFIKDRVENIKLAGKAYAFDTSQRVRDELRTLIGETPVTITSYSFQLPADYARDVMLKISYKNRVLVSDYISINELSGINDDYYARPCGDRIYHYIDNNTVRIVHSGTDGSYSGTYMYLRKYKQPMIGLTDIGAPANLQHGSTYYFNTSGTVDSVSYSTGSVITIDPAQPGLLSSGNVVEIVDLPLPDIAHEEIARRAAAIFSGTVNNFDNLKVKSAEIMSQ